ncbi:hypothetical protein BAUCODRAFT_65196 [Baudoinia panamericana UAMH 10762]|uniref:Glycosyl transferase CAP10 domain-containing protein n=1 Tax=Baudoinia panamericana (strain UAMH 10762) TaxID=717646 RepID=M2N5F5_BAUPA|nr:uncharacterized protein BAUCODRAFT_65196 [Baudoinia panamericana UAMH 10762]EMC99263.1 hypothetical protein BAUCODRAFT_65196 [Baudoinia panamericana UAMH 10762]
MQATQSRNYGLSEQDCQAYFPDLYKEIDRAVEYRNAVGKITLDELDVSWRADGVLRGMIHDNQLYIIDAHGVCDHNHRPRTMATLHAINRAVTASVEPLPDIEFTFVDHDTALLDDDDNHTTWAYSRLANQESLWLMPDFGFWAWPEYGMRSYSELQANLDETEEHLLDKAPQIVWRGGTKAGFGGHAREGLLKHSTGQSWSAVEMIDWANRTDVSHKLITMAEHCGYMFAAHTEGDTYSGRLKYLLNCHSVLLSHELHWIEHFHHLLDPGPGPGQNYVRVEPDFADLPEKMESLLLPSSREMIEAITDNARGTFRNRYLTPAAEACYWRALARGWARVQGFEPQVWEDGEQVQVDYRGGMLFKKKRRGVPFEAYVITEAVEWEVPAVGRSSCR